MGSTETELQGESGRTSAGEEPTNELADAALDDDEDVVRVDPFDERYLASLNHPITEMEQRVMHKNASILGGGKSQLSGAAAGINASVFSVSSDVTQVIKPKNGVKLRARRVEIGSGAYINPDPSKMSLQKYNKIAESYKSLKDIAAAGSPKAVARGDTSVQHASGQLVGVQDQALMQRTG